MSQRFGIKIMRHPWGVSVWAPGCSMHYGRRRFLGGRYLIAHVGTRIYWRSS